MTDTRRPGRPKVGDQQVGRERIVDGVIEYIRSGRSDISRREIASYLKITPALLTYYFPRGFSLLTEAVGRQASRWQQRIDDLCKQQDLNPSQKMDHLQQIIISMYANDAHIVELQTSLWRAGHMPFCLIAEMKKKMYSFFLSAEYCSEIVTASFLTSIIWGACEHCVRDHSDDLQPHIFDSEELVSGNLVIHRMAETPGKISVGATEL